jgi:hypothetical protein
MMLRHLPFLAGVSVLVNRASMEDLPGTFRTIGMLVTSLPGGVDFPVLPFLGARIGVFCRTAFPGRQQTARKDGLERPSYT